MSTDKRYWDSDCFLGWLQAERDKETACMVVLQAAEDGKCLILTSALTIAEVLALRNASPIPATERAKVEAFFRNDYIVVRNITRHIAEMAREYVWDHGVNPKDALHVATAVDASLELLNTFDRPLQGKSGLLGSPGLVIEDQDGTSLNYQWTCLMAKLPSEKKSQSEKFIATARELECDEDEDRFNAMLKRIAPKKDEKPAPQQ